MANFNNAEMIHNMKPYFVLRGETIDTLSINKSVIAGDGLTGGGVLTSNVTLNVGEGNGLDITADAVAVITPASSGLAIDGTGVYVDLQTPSGLLAAGSGLKLGTPASVTTTSPNEVAAGHTHVWNTIPINTYQTNLGQLSKKYQTLHVAELWADTLVAQDTIATIGGRILVGPTTVLTQNLSTTDTTIYVEHNQMASGDIIYLEKNSKVEFMSVGSGASSGSELLSNTGFETAGAGGADVFANWIESVGDGSVLQVHDYPISSIQAFIKAGIEDESAQEAYIAGGGTGVTSNKQAYIDVIGNIDSGQQGFMAGTSNNVSAIEAYTHGLDTTLDLQAAYVAGGLASSDNQQAYMDSAYYDFVYAGSYAAKLTSGTLSNTRIYQDISVTAGMGYTVSFWSRGDGLNAGRFAIYDQSHSAYLIPISTTGNETESYAQTTIYFTAPIGTTTISVLLYCPDVDGGSAYFDSVSALLAGYSYTITRNLDGSGANVWDAGDAVFNTGTTGDGFIDLYSISGVNAGTTVGPTIVGNVRTGAGYADWVEHWAIGNLNGVYGQSSDVYGVGLGEYVSGKEHVLITDTAIRFKNYTTEIASWVGSVITLGNTSNENVILNSSSITLNQGNTPHIKLLSVGNVYIGGDADVKGAGVDFATFVVADPSYNGESIGAGDVLIGDNSSGIGNILWDASDVALQFRNGQVDHFTLDLQWGATNRRSIRIGEDTSSANTTGLLINAGTSGAGSTTWNNTTRGFVVINAGGNNVSVNSQTLSSGDILIGNNSGSKANVFFDYSVGRMNFRSGITVESYIDNDGAYYAGNGRVRINTSGVSIGGTGALLPESESEITFYEGTTFATQTGGIEVVSNMGVGAGYFTWASFYVTKYDTGGADVSSKIDMVSDYYGNHVSLTSTEVRLNGGVKVGLTSPNPAYGEMYISGDVRLAKGLVVGNTSTDPGIGYCIIEEGLRVGDLTAPTQDDIRATADIVAGGGLYAGLVTGEPATGEIVATGDIRAGSDLKCTAGLYVGNSGGTTYADDAIVEGGAVFGASGINPGVGYVQILNGLCVGTTGQQINDAIYISQRLFINETASTDVARGICIKYGVGGYTGNHWIDLKSNVDHGITNYAETDTFMRIVELEDEAGGVVIEGFCDGTAPTRGMMLVGNSFTVGSGSSSGAVAALMLRGNGKSGTALAEISGATYNVVGIESNGVLKAMFKGDGDLDLAGFIRDNQWDDYDDVKLMTGLSAMLTPSLETVLKDNFYEWIDYARPVLEEGGVITVNDGQNGNPDDGSIFISVQGMWHLTIDTIRQMNNKMTRMERAMLAAGMEIPQLAASS